MSRPPKPPTEHEMRAIKAAEAEWLHWRAIYQTMPADIQDKRAATKLREAAKALQDALDPYWQNAGSTQAVLLVAAMQKIQLFRAAQSTYHQMLDDLVEPLQLIQDAASTLIKMGSPADGSVTRWVCMAADFWIDAGLPTPTAKGRFFRALESLPLDRSIPSVTPDRVYGALERWKQMHQFP